MTPVDLKHCRRARCWAEIISRSELFAGLRAIAVKEVACGRALFAFELNFEEFERRIVAAAYEKMIAFRVKCRDGQCSAGRSGFPDVQILTAKLRVCARPGLKAANAVEELGGRACEIQLPVFFHQNRRQGCFRIVLRARFNRTRLQAAKTFDHETSSDLC